MKKFYLLTLGCCAFFFSMVGLSQESHTMKRAFVDEQGQIQVEEYQTTRDFTSVESDIEMLDGFPRVFYANQYFKNFRGAVVADIDGDGVQEIVTGIDETVYAIDGSGEIIWESETLPGNINYPPAVADIDGDGLMEIAVNTNYTNNFYDGSVCLLDYEGNMVDGWPVSYENHSMSCAPALADVDEDGTMEIISLERKTGSGDIQAGVHILTPSGTPFSDNWPVILPGTPAVTPSIGDVDADDSNDIVVALSNGELYVLDIEGQVHDNFPVTNSPESKFSYQSPALADLTGDGYLEIAGAWHGDQPGYFVYKHNGELLGDNWPYGVSGWTYTTPTVVDGDSDGEYEVYYSMPTYTQGSQEDVIFGFTPQGEMLDNFPISKEGGCEGVISVADVDANGIQDLVFTSNITDAEGYGFIHAYALDGSGEVAGFPLRPKGFTFTNSAVLGDVNDDNLLDLTALSYSQTFASQDSVFISTYNLGITYNPDDILSNGYHGGNAHAGLVEGASGTGIANYSGRMTRLEVYPNPSSGNLTFHVPESFSRAVLKVMDSQGRLVFEEKIIAKERSGKTYDFNHLNKGFYFIILTNGNETKISKWLKK